MSHFRRAFRNRNFLLFWFAQVISQFGDRINQMALIGLIASRAPGSTLGLAKLLSFSIIPVFIVGPFAGVFVDRWDHRKTLYVCDILRGLLILTIPTMFIFRDSMLPIYAVVFLVFCLSRFHVLAKMAIIPDVVAERDLLLANSLFTVTGMIAFVLGVLLGGLIVDAAGPVGGFTLDAITFFIAAAMVLGMSKKSWRRVQVSEQSLRHQIVAVKNSVFIDMRDGFRYLWVNPDIRFIAQIFFTLLAAAGAIYVVIIVFVQQAFGLQIKYLGFLAPVLGVGLFCGAVLYGRFGQKMDRYRIIFTCLMLSGLMLFIFTLTIKTFPVFMLAACLSFLLGIMVGPIFIAANTLVHEVCDTNMRGKVFGGLEIVIHAGFLTTMLISSYLADQFVSNAVILTSAGILISVVGMVGMFTYKSRLARQSELKGKV